MNATPRRHGERRRATPTTKRRVVRARARIHTARIERLWTFRFADGHKHSSVASFRIPHEHVVGWTLHRVDRQWCRPGVAAVAVAVVVVDPRRETHRTHDDDDHARDMSSSQRARVAPDAGERARWPAFTLDEVRRHATLRDGWVVVRGRVYDISAFASTHPGFHNAGQVSTAIAIARALGSDATEEFEHIHSPKAWAQLVDFQIGVLAETDEDAVVDARVETPVPEWLSRERDFWVKYSGGVSASTLRYLEASGCPQGVEDVEAEARGAGADASGVGTDGDGATARRIERGGVDRGATRGGDVAHMVRRIVGTSFAALVAGVVGTRVIRSPRARRRAVVVVA